MVERWFAHVVSAVVLACVLWPLAWRPPRDSFPLSNYPMFARERRSAELDAVYAVAFDQSGTRHWVPPALVGSREVLQARAILERAARGGRAGARTLCAAIARRVAAERGELAGAVQLRIVRGRHDAMAFFDRGELGPERTLASCRVNRAEPGR